MSRADDRVSHETKPKAREYDVQVGYNSNGYYTTSRIVVWAYDAADAFVQVTKCPQSYGIYGSSINIDFVKPMGY